MFGVDQVFLSFNTLAKYLDALSILVLFLSATLLLPFACNHGFPTPLFCMLFDSKILRAVASVNVKWRSYSFYRTFVFLWFFLGNLACLAGG